MKNKLTYYAGVLCLIFSFTTANAQLLPCILHPVGEVTIEPSGPTEFCEGDSVTLCAFPEGPGFTYTWKDIITGETLSTEQCLTVYESGDYYVRVFNEFGCHSECTPTTVTVNPNPVCSIEGPTSFCVGDEVILTAPAGYTYLWSTGETTQSITVTEGGTYSVTITNEFECSATCSVDVTAYEIPVVTIEADGPTEFCEGDSVTLCAFPEGPGYTYTWKDIITGETLSNEQCLTVYESGNYYVRVFNEFGCHSECTPIVVTVYPNPVCSIEADGPTEFCEGGSVTLTAPAGYSYLWSTGETTQSIIASEAGTYSVTITSGFGCSSTCSIEVTTTPGPEAYITPGDTTICKGRKVILIANAGVGYTYQWYKNDVLIPGATNNYYKTQQPGVYTVEVTSADGCSAISAGSTVTVILPPTLSLNTPDGLDLCPDGEVLLEIVTEAGATFQWYFNGSPIPGATGNTYTATEVGEYTALVTNSAGCSTRCKGITVVNSCRLGNSAEGNSSLEIYPNPAEGMVKLSIVLDESARVILEFMNMEGQILHEEIMQDVHTFTKEFDLSSYPKGVYFLTITTDLQKITKKIVLQ
ncbi:MAG: T9SS type A sorting domain-containing protein [Chitinophagales bacterium]|nr:T9SS type A sorting domain-containing protein [Chitinophagales bacterium]